ncbi:MAG TPA: Rieske (2Fe-2S) protein [Gemmataceae bacterium]
MPDPTPPAPQPAAPSAAPPVAATAPAASPKPPMPAKPAPPPAKKGEDRRNFIVRFITSPFAIAWAAFCGTMAAWTLGSTRFLYPNVLSEPPSKVRVGPPSDFEEGKVTDKFKDRNMWVVRYQGKIYALSTTCTHLGCTPNWLEADKKFKCPCHGSGFYITGVNFEGPAPRPLERWAIGEEDGQLVVDKSKKFQRELGQWDNPESYFKV